MPDLCPKHRNRLKKWRTQGHDTEQFMRAWDIHGSVSSANRFVSRLTGQLCHGMSDLEYHFAVIADFSRNVDGFQMNHPCDPEATWKIAWDLGYAHHRIDEGLVVPTVDFLLDVRINGKKVQEARDVKPASVLHDRALLEKLEIVRVYWENRGVGYGIWVDETLDHVLAKNLAEFHSMTNPDDFQIEEKEIDLAREYMEGHFSEAETLAKLAMDCDQALGFRRDRLGTSLTIAHFLIIRHEWGCDLHEPFDPSTRETLGRITIK